MVIELKKKKKTKQALSGPFFETGSRLLTGFCTSADNRGAKMQKTGARRELSICIQELQVSHDPSGSCSDSVHFMPYWSFQTIPLRIRLIFLLYRVKSNCAIWIGNRMILTSMVRNDPQLSKVIRGLELDPNSHKRYTLTQGRLFCKGRLALTANLEWIP